MPDGSIQSLPAAAASQQSCARAGRRFDVYLATNEELQPRQVFFRGAERLTVVYVFADESSWNTERRSGVSARRGENDVDYKPQLKPVPFDGADCIAGKWQHFYGCNRV